MTVRIKRRCEARVSASAAYCAAKTTLRFLIGTILCPIQTVGEWLSLVEHLVRDQGVGGSNPLSPTNLSNNLQPKKSAFDAYGVQFGVHGRL